MRVLVFSSSLPTQRRLSRIVGLSTIAGKCQFSPDMGPPVFGQMGPLRQVTLEKLQAKTNVTIDALKVR